jgi:AraC family transcriptional regulator
VGFIVIISPDISRIEMASLKVAHCILPPWHNGEVDSVTMPGSIGLAFTQQTGAIVRGGNGRAARRDVVANSIGLGGAEPTAWLHVKGPSDIIEITASRDLRREIAEELNKPQHANLDDIDNWHDPIVHSIALRFRAALRDRWPFDPLEAEELARAAYARVLQRQFGASKRPAGALAPARLANVVDFITANLPRQLAELANVAALSPSILPAVSAALPAFRQIASSPH